MRDSFIQIVKGLIVMTVFIHLSACMQQTHNQGSMNSPQPLYINEFESKYNMDDYDRELKVDDKKINSMMYKKETENNKEPKDNRITKKHKHKVKVKGIYVSGWIAGSAKMKKLTQMVMDTELNAMVIDVKNDSGDVTYNSDVEMVNVLQSDSRRMITDMAELIKKLKDKQIYTIARIVVFKDPILAGKKPELAMHYKNGAIWKDPKNVSWVDPYKQEVWKYNLELAKEAAELGFDEIQFDYVRFPDNGKKMDEEVKFNNPEDLSKAQVISNFLSEARKYLGEKGVFISADVFGLTTTVSDDMGIGQDWSMISQNVDFISPMIYPSHYSKGIYGIRHPDLKPYEVVMHAIEDGNEKNDKLKIKQKTTAIIRPWIQSFTASWIHPHLHYTHTEVKLQIKAAQEKGVEEYLLWNPLCEYTFIKSVQ